MNEPRGDRGTALATAEPAAMKVGKNDQSF